MKNIKSNGKSSASNILYVMLIAQALITVLMLFAEGLVKYLLIGVFCVVDIMILFSLIQKTWSHLEMFTFATFFTSLLFLMFYIFNSGTNTVLIGIGVTILFILSAMLMHTPAPHLPDLASSRLSSSQSITKPSIPQMPRTYDVDTYDMDKFEKEIDEELNVQNYVPAQNNASLQKTISKNYTTKNEVARNDAKFKARAMAYELEREVAELKRAEKYVEKKDVEENESELVREAMELNKAQKYFERGEKIAELPQTKVHNQSKIPSQYPSQYIRQRTVDEKQRALERESQELEKANSYLEKRSSKDKQRELQGELKREASQLNNAEKLVEQRIAANVKSQLLAQAKKLKSAEKTAEKYLKTKSESVGQRKKEMKNEAKSLIDAEKQINRLQYLDQQEKMVGQAKAIAKAQKDIDALAKKTANVAVKKVSSKTSESLYFATKNGKNFHEPGCLAIKKVPKNKLILYTDKKAAMKKGLQPCRVCIPK